MAYARTRPDPVTLAAYGGLLAGLMAGAGAGLAVASMLPGPMQAAATLYESPDVCAMPLADDGIGFHILMDEARRRGPAAHA